MNRWKSLALAVPLAVASLALPARAALPAPTPEQQAAAAAKKAAADAQAAKEKQQLAESMERVAAYWRQRAQSQGWKVNAQVAVQPVQGFNASATQSSPSGQPGGQLGAAAAQQPIRSEKLGTAPPSADVKTKQDRPAAPAR